MKNISLAAALLLCLLLAGCIEDDPGMYPDPWQGAGGMHHNAPRYGMPTFTHSEGEMHRNKDTHRSTQRQEWNTDHSTREHQWQDTPNGGIARSQGSSHSQRRTEEHTKEKSTERWEGSRMDIRFR
ncbi:MAG: hypothetical protein PHN64_00895 [Desulfovibrionaceae bacterium]|nr:hypothetical protein [Desulfovibrionaceae bacterium]